jgi:phenylacetate-coenzyme A ligase PaaK-like adenylate-forming protein
MRQRHFHINDDWVIVEPVDSENNPVPAGVRHKILLTNLYTLRSRSSGTKSPTA